ncbi:ATP synthase protein I [Pasteurella testudinis DSM 23072]|uniref:ATP synthase protein I n=1 Tax=Pasteurella testudinis DSM 23072 TaxID=1122938 RepID=A0A1W1V2M0_9PAST|nr:ATP synthase subunit I [Pasteurella testudinis]SMB87548.1 ATP synthase protein I [Pasteurella testudinis DSM 23072]SUB50516.1 ATP synthase subunit I [Pasteurella testudinis]
MSAVLDKNKTLYRKVFIIEWVFILGIYALFGLLQPALSLSFLLGALIALLPQMIFVIYVFYLRAGVPFSDKAKVLYQGEGIKIGLMVIALLVVFINIELNPIVFFTGYFGLILFNNLLPFVLPLVAAKAKN